MANVGRSEITPELEFLSPPAALACSQRLFTRCTFQLPGTGSFFVSYNSPFFIRALTTGRNFASSFVEAASALSLSAAEVTLCPFILEALSLSAGGGRRGRRSKREDLPPSCRLQTLTHAPAPHSPAFVTCLLVENINTLAGNQSLRVLAKAACPNPPTSSRSPV